METSQRKCFKMPAMPKTFMMHEALIRYRANEHQRTIKQLKEVVKFVLQGIGFGAVMYILLVLILFL